MVGLPSVLVRRPETRRLRARGRRARGRRERGRRARGRMARAHRARGRRARGRRARGRKAWAQGAPTRLGRGSNDGWWLLVVVEVKPRLCIYIENPTSAPNQPFQEEFRMPRTLLYDPGMVGLPSVLVRTPKARTSRARARRAYGARAGARLGRGSNDGWWLLVVVEVKPRLCIYIENPTSAPNQPFQEEFRMPRTLLYDPGMVGLPSVLVRTPKARTRKARRRARRAALTRLGR